MGRKPLPVEDKIEKITICLPKKLIDEIKLHGKYNVLIRQLLDEYFRNLNNL